MDFIETLTRYLRLLFRRDVKWSIALYAGDDLLKLSPKKSVKQPILTPEDVIDVEAVGVADPFMVHRNGSWFLFYEVIANEIPKGSIGLAYSEDGERWNYRGIVLSEPFHLSYPYVFEWDGEFFMIPETGQANAVRLYKAEEFPYKWKFERTLLQGFGYVDSSIFYFRDKWWLYTSTRTNNVLSLYCSDDLFGPWIEHPKSPVVKNSKRTARPAGRVLVQKDISVIRFAQNDVLYYGRSVSAFKVKVLTADEYEEEPVSSDPILGPGTAGWNSSGMHHIDAVQMTDGRWMACVDAQHAVVRFRNKRQ
jgi:hypothetical protein